MALEEGTGASEPTFPASEWTTIVEALRRIRAKQPEERNAALQEEAEKIADPRVRRGLEAEYHATAGESFEGEHSEPERSDEDEDNEGEESESTASSGLTPEQLKREQGEWRKKFREPDIRDIPSDADFNATNRAIGRAKTAEDFQKLEEIYRALKAKAASGESSAELGGSEADKEHARLAEMEAAAAKRKAKPEVARKTNWETPEPSTELYDAEALSEIKRELKKELKKREIGGEEEAHILAQIESIKTEADYRPIYEQVWFDLKPKRKGRAEEREEKKEDKKKGKSEKDESKKGPGIPDYGEPNSVKVIRNRDKVTKIRFGADGRPVEEETTDFKPEVLPGGKKRADAESVRAGKTARRKRKLLDIIAEPKSDESKDWGDLKTADELLAEEEAAAAERRRHRERAEDADDVGDEERPDEEHLRRFAARNGYGTEAEIAQSVRDAEKAMHEWNHRSWYRRIRDWWSGAQPPRHPELEYALSGASHFTDREKAIMRQTEKWALAAAGYNLETDQDAKKRGLAKRFASVKEALKSNFKGVGKAMLLATAVTTGVALFGATSGLLAVPASAFVGTLAGSGVGQVAYNVLEGRGLKKTAAVTRVVLGVLAGWGTAHLAHGAGVDQWVSNLFNHGGGATAPVVPHHVDSSPAGDVTHTEGAAEIAATLRLPGDITIAAGSDMARFGIDGLLQTHLFRLEAFQGLDGDALNQFIDAFRRTAVDPRFVNDFISYANGADAVVRGGDLIVHAGDTFHMSILQNPAFQRALGDNIINLERMHLLPDLDGPRGVRAFIRLLASGIR